MIEDEVVPERKGAPPRVWWWWQSLQLEVLHGQAGETWRHSVLLGQPVVRQARQTALGLTKRHRRALVTCLTDFDTRHIQSSGDATQQRVT